MERGESLSMQILFHKAEFEWLAARGSNGDFIVCYGLNIGILYDLNCVLQIFTAISFSNRNRHIADTVFATTNIILCATSTINIINIHSYKIIIFFIAVC